MWAKNYNEEIKNGGEQLQINYRDITNTELTKGKSPKKSSKFVHGGVAPGP